MGITLEKLLKKAYKTGESNKNGRMMFYGYGYSEKGELREQWHVIDEDGKFEIRHWGTVILATNKGVVKTIYGQSNSDRDALNQVFEWLNMPYHAHYYPSKDELEVHVNDSDDLVVKI